MPLLQSKFRLTFGRAGTIYNINVELNKYNKYQICTLKLKVDTSEGTWNW